MTSYISSLGSAAAVGLATLSVTGSFTKAALAFCICMFIHNEFSFLKGE